MWRPALLILIAISSFCQSKQPDVAPADTTEVNRLIQLSRKNKWVDSYQSLKYADQALALAQGLQYKKGIAAADNLKGFCFWTFGDNELAIQAAMQALEIAEKENRTGLQGESNYILARAYMDLGEDKRARETIAKAENIAMLGNDWEQTTSVYNLKGVILFIDDKYDSALYYYNKAYETGKSHNVDPINFPRIISNIGECYARENPQLAFEYYNKALGLARETGNRIAEASALGHIGRAYFGQGDIKNAEARFQSALGLAQILGLRRVVRQAYGGLVDIKLRQGKGEEAVVYLRKYYAVRDSLLGSFKIRQIVELEAQHELQLKEQNIKLLESEKQVATLWKDLLLGLIVVLVLMMGGLYWFQRYRYRQNRKLLDLEIDYLTQQNKETVERYQALITPESEGNFESYDQKFLRQAISFVETNLSDPQLSVEIMASGMNTSRTSLHRRIKSITGFSPSELIRSIRLRKAAKLIVNRVDSVTQIALQVGFEDYSHFSKAFKKHFGTSPSGYEEQSRPRAPQPQS